MRSGVIAGSARFGVLSACALVLANCGQSGGQGPFSRFDPKYGVSSSPRLIADGEPVPKGGGAYRIGKPYTIAGKVYEPTENPNYRAEGMASWYGSDFHGRATANGEIFDMASVTAAHPTLPIPSYVRVTNLKNRKSIIARVNDRGPYHANRLIDVSVRTAKLLGFYEHGITKVRVEYVGRASLGGSDDDKLAATLREGEPAPGPSEVRVAAARPFLPRFADISESVAVPASRPSEPGQDDDARATPRRATASRDTPVRSAEATAPEDNRWERGFASRFAPAHRLPQPPAETPVSAFGAAPQPAATGFNARGLY